MSIKHRRLQPDGLKQRSLKSIELDTNILESKLERSNSITELFTSVQNWRIESVKKIDSAFERANSQLLHIQDSRRKLIDDVSDLSNEVRAASRQRKRLHENDIKQMGNLLDHYKETWDSIEHIKIKCASLSTFDLIRVDGVNVDMTNIVPSLPNERHMQQNRTQAELPDYEYSYSFGMNESTPEQIFKLFDVLRKYHFSEKPTIMNEGYAHGTDMMERFLSATVLFKNVSVSSMPLGILGFQIDRPIESMPPNKLIQFPFKSVNSFQMTVNEIVHWQKSYVVYADKSVPDIDERFLHKALQGKIQTHDEAFRMKFIVRISKCPILKASNGRIIHRVLKDTWPHRIKLVSITGINLNGRFDDFHDTTTYISNWKNVYQLKPQSGIPQTYNSKDFHRLPSGPTAILNEEQLLNDFIRMTRLRLRACDYEKVEVVVETGLAFGRFSGKYVGVDEQVRRLSAQAIRMVLEMDGSNYKHICALVLASPIIISDNRKDPRKAAHHAFVEEFKKSNYKGLIPVFVTYHDIHEITIAIARFGFNVSLLNLTDSRGVFGASWQTDKTAIEEIIAVTTGGLLVQHHLINPYVLNKKNYLFI